MPASAVIFEYVPFALFKDKANPVPDIGCIVPLITKLPVPLYAVPAVVNAVITPVVMASTVLIVTVISFNGVVPGIASPASINIVCPAPYKSPPSVCVSV